MKKLRKEIDSIDSQILKLLAKRKGLARKVRDYKKAHGMPIVVAAREKVVYKTRTAWGKKLGLSPTMVRNLMAVIIAESRKDQKI